MIDFKLVSLLAEELNNELKGCRIEQIRQPSKDILIFAVRKSGVNRKLLISGASGKARVHFTEQSYESPAQAPMLCMLLRKHLTGAYIESVCQIEDDRNLAISMVCKDEIGRSWYETLYVEMLNRCPNAILVGEDGLIIDCLYRRDYEPELYRRVFPGMIYRVPKKPVSVRRSDRDDFSLPESFSTVSEYLDAYYSEKEKSELYARKSKELRTSINSAVKRISRKLASQRNELEISRGREAIRRKADLITANIWKIKKGDELLRCEDFYDESCPEVLIELDPLKTPQECAAALYKDYMRKKKAEEYLTVLIAKAEDQLEYLSSTLAFLSEAHSDSEIEAIRQELADTGFIKAKGTKKAKPQPAKPLSFISPTGFEILVGRNNRENDELTFKIARRTDLWFHVKNFHGSHVILRTLGGEPTEADIEKAAGFAFAYSEASGNGSAAIDYCQVRYVRKPSGSLPGKVIYTDYKTLIVKSS